MATGTAPPSAAKAVPFNADVKVPSGVVISVSKIESVEGKASLPGEVAGPSVRFTVDVKNNTSSSIALNNIAVNAYFGADQAPAIQLSEPGAKGFPKSVAAGSSGTGIFVFNIPKADRGKVTLTVDYDVNTPTIVFSGAVN
jgi:hypothetical protein